MQVRRKCMGYHIVIAESRDITRHGLKNIFTEDPLIASIREVITESELQRELKACMPDLLIIHQSLARNLELFPKHRFVILATRPDEKELFEAYTNGARGYLLESSSVDLIRMTLRLVEEMFLLDPVLTPWLLSCINKEALPAAAHKTLTTREQEILQLVRAGLTNSEISNRLYITEATVKTHVASVFRKLDIRRRSMAMTTPLISMPLAQSYV